MTGTNPFLPGMTKDEKFILVITLVIYCGTRELIEAARKVQPREAYNIWESGQNRKYRSCSSIFSCVLLLLLIPVRITALPSPGILAHFLNASLGHPAQFFLRLCGVRIAGRDIAGTSGFDLIGDLHTISRLEIFHDVEHRIPLSGSQIINTW